MLKKLNVFCFCFCFLCFYKYLQDLLKLTPKKKKKVLFIVRDRNTNVGSQKIPRVTGKFDLEVPNEAGQRLTEFFQEKILITTNLLFPTTPKPTLHMDNIKWSISKYSLQPKMEKLFTVRKNKTGS